MPRDTDEEREDEPETETSEATEAAARSTVGDDEVEERLLEGETVRTEVTETEVVEHVVAETETIESEVTDRRIVGSRITEAELVGWDVEEADVDIDLVVDEDVATGTVETTDEGSIARYDDLDLDARVEGDVTVDVGETWRLRRDVDEEVTIETRLVDVDVDVVDEVVDETGRTEIEVAGIERSIVESEMFDTDRDPAALVETDVIQTEPVGEDRLESRLVQRRVYEDEVRRRRRHRFDIVESELLETEGVDSQLLESDVVEIDYGERDVARTGEADEVGELDEEVRTEVTSDDQGKKVVDETGEDIGVVSSVEGGVAYVDPHPGLLEKLEMRLGWADRDEDDYPLQSDQIREIDHDRIVVTTEGAVEELAEEEEERT